MSTIYSRLVLLACVLALCVVGLGAYTRLTDAGLGCPDWPGCYGHLTAPSTVDHQAQAAKNFPGQTIEVRKAWTEMIHRYLAGTLGLLVIGIALTLLKKTRSGSIDGPGKLFALSLIALVVGQAALGMWTVTMYLLPVVVMGHLLGGLTLLALLSWLAASLMTKREQRSTIEQKLRPWVILGLIIVFLQITLGGWTSSNYAALVCPTFPFCHGQLFPDLALQDALKFLPDAAGAIGSQMTLAGRVTVQMFHRYGAFITFMYLLSLGIFILLKVRQPPMSRMAKVMLAVLCLQVTLGIVNVVALLPLSVAVLHNVVAAGLLVTMVFLNAYLTRRRNA